MFMATMPPGAAIEVKPSLAICKVCGIAYGKHNGYFYRNYSQLYKSNGYLTICKTCVDNLYEDFLRECKDPKLACHQMCRKLNVYWSEEIYNGVLQGSTHRTVMSGYLTRATTAKNRNKCYDDFLREIGMLFEIPQERVEEPTPTAEPEPVVVESEPEEEIEIADSVRRAWGTGYSNKQYAELEERRKFWVDELQAKNIDTDDIAVAALLRQIVGLELDINRERAAGNNVDKLMNTFNTLVNSALLKPSQKKSDVDAAIENTPLGMWVLRYENERPLPRDENKSQIIKFVHTWLYGHLGKMLGLRNSYTQMYEDEIDRLTIQKPEYANEDDDLIITDAFGEDVFDNE